MTMSKMQRLGVAEDAVADLKRRWLRGELEWGEYLPAVLAAERAVHACWLDIYGR